MTDMGRPPKYDWRDYVLPAGMAFVKSFRTGALYQAAIDRYFDKSAYERSLRQEAADLQALDDRWE
jgi:hypothetical protein